MIKNLAIKRMKRAIPLVLVACLALISVSCMAVSRILLEPTPTALPSATPVPPSVTPSPVPTASATPDYCPNGDCISACMKHLPAIAQPGGASNGLKSSHRFDGGHDGRVLVTYVVAGDQIKSPQDMPGIPNSLGIYQKDRISQKKIWDYFAAIIPAEQRKLLTEYDIFTDGSSNILAAVTQSNTNIG